MKTNINDNPNVKKGDLRLDGTEHFEAFTSKWSLLLITWIYERKWFEPNNQIFM